MVHRSMRWPGSDSLNFAVSERFHRSSSAFTACTPVTEERVSHRIDAGQGAPWSTSLVQVGTGVLGTCHLPSCLRRAKRAGRQDRSDSMRHIVALRPRSIPAASTNFLQHLHCRSAEDALKAAVVMASSCKEQNLLACSRAGEEA